MLLINLLPPAERRTGWPLNRIAVAGFLALLAMLGAVYGYGMYTIAKYEKLLAETRTQYELLRPTREMMLQTNKSQQATGAKNNLLVALTKQRRAWYTAIAQLGVMIPREVWLTELSTVDNQTLRLQGMAKSYPDLAGFMHKIEADAMFAEPVLVKAERDNTLPVHRFEILLKFKGL